MNFCITGGATGGHLNIADIFCKALVQRGHKVIFIGSISGQDRMWFGDNKIFSNTFFLNTSGVVNQDKLGKIKSLFKIFLAVIQSRKILKQHNIDAVISVGGFSSAPASFASFVIKIPLFIHEQNAVAGKLNSLLKPYAKLFLSVYEKNGKKYGYPVKDEFIQSARIRKKLRNIIFLGGSQGAVAINDLALQVAKQLQDKEIKIIHQCGEKNYENVKNQYQTLGIKVELYSFSKDVSKLIERADMAVSRAGASTLWELCANGLVTFFIPYPYAAGDHQFFNAQFIVKEDMGWCVRQNDDLMKQLLKAIDEPLEEKSKKLINYFKRDGIVPMIELFETTIRN